MDDPFLCLTMTNEISQYWMTNFIFSSSQSKKVDFHNIPTKL